MEHRQIDKDDTEMEPFQNLPETFTIIDEIVSRVFGKGPERVPEGGPVGVGRGGTAEQLRHVMWKGRGGRQTPGTGRDGTGLDGTIKMNKWNDTDVVATRPAILIAPRTSKR